MTDSGQSHFAFSVSCRCAGWLGGFGLGLNWGVAIESRVAWERGRAEYLIFGSPDGNLGELVTPGLLENLLMLLRRSLVYYLADQPGRRDGRGDCRLRPRGGRSGWRVGAGQLAWICF